MLGRKAAFWLAKRSRQSERAVTSSGNGGDGCDESEHGIKMTTSMVVDHHALLEEREALYSPINSTGVYNMRVDGDKERLAVNIWLGDFLAPTSALTSTIGRMRSALASTILAHALSATPRGVSIAPSAAVRVRVRRAPPGVLLRAPTSTSTSDQG